MRLSLAPNVFPNLSFSRREGKKEGRKIGAVGRKSWKGREGREGRADMKDGKGRKGRKAVKLER